MLRSVGVIGGGTAGWLTALALKRRFPALAVTLIESPDIPIIGVGEATTTLMPPFLHQELGLDVVSLFEEVAPTFKLGIRFEWGERDFNYPFGDNDPTSALAHDGHLGNQSLVSMLMDAGAAPLLRGPDDQLLSALTQIKFAYHLDNAPFVGYLRAAGERAGVVREEFTIADVIRSGGDIGAIRSRDGLERRFDFWVDATGFQSLLIGKCLESPFIDFSSSLPCDRAIAARVPRNGPPAPFTTAETMAAGWCWRVPVVEEDHRGYVYASAFLDDERAVEEMRRKNPTMGDPRILRYRCGRYRDFWIGNTVAIGNSYGFVEPLESTALEMVIIEIRALLAHLESGDRKAANDRIGQQWDFLRWFLAVHYRFNRRLETTFWRAARNEVDVSGFAELLALYQREGSLTAIERPPFERGTPTFGVEAVLLILLGLGIAAPIRSRQPAPDWAARVERDRRIVRWALPHGDALQNLSPQILNEFVRSKRSWCSEG